MIFTEIFKNITTYFFGNHPFKDEVFDYNRYWIEPYLGEGYFIHQTNKFRLIERQIENGSRVLEIGCGEGMLLNHLKETRNIKGVGIDISEQALGQARLKGIEVVQADVTSPDFQLDGTYDYIIISEVLEHLPKPEEVLQKVKGKFTRYLVITIPNSGFLGDRLRMLAGKFPRQWQIHPSEHLRFWTVADFYFWLEQLGFAVKTYYGFPRSSLENRLMLWKYYPRLFARHCLFQVSEAV